MAPSRMKPQDRRFTVSENVLTCYRGFEVGNILPVTPLGMATGRVGSDGLYIPLSLAFDSV